MSGSVGEAEAAVVLAATAAAVAGSPDLVWQHLDVGAPVNVLIWITVGAAAGVWNNRFKHKGNLIGAFFASFILSTGCIVGVPHLTDYRWDSAGLQAATGLVVAFLSQNWGPRLLRAIDTGSIADLRGFIAEWIHPTRRNPDDPR